MRLIFGLPALMVALAVLPARHPHPALGAVRPGTRVLLDAHNAYPYQGRWADRLDRALAAALPLAVEQDLVWRDGRSVVSHGEPFDGREPTLEEHFFVRIRPLMEAALAEDSRQQWPLITLNLDFKTNEPEHHRYVRDLLGKYDAWLTTAVRTGAPADISGLAVGPLLVLTGDSALQELTFHESIAPGRKVRVFGSTPADEPRPRRTNYRRWTNHSWTAVEPEGQPLAADWSREDEARLKRLVSAAHAAGLWVRFYTLNGHDPTDRSGGWSDSYNFGSLAAARQRWDAAIRAGVDFVAVDQYEDFAASLARPPLLLEGAVKRDDHERVLTRAFDVPARTRLISVTLEYDTELRTVIDLRLEGPLGFRGWRGGGPQTIALGEYSASFGYSPGPREPGIWKILLGVPNIRAGLTAPSRLRIELDAPSAPEPLRAGPPFAPEGTRLRVPSGRVYEAGRPARLDFVALTDHKTASHRMLPTTRPAWAATGTTATIARWRPFTVWKW